MDDFILCKTNGVYSALYRRGNSVIKLSDVPFANSVEDTESAVDKTSAREAAVLNVLGGHPHIVTTKEVTLRPFRRGRRLSSPQRGNRPHLGIEMERGLPVRVPQGRAPPAKVSRIARFVVEIGSGLAYAHDANICHRDIKPDNRSTVTHRWVLYFD